MNTRGAERMRLDGKAAPEVVIAGNWKMNLGPVEARAFCDGFRPGLDPLRVRILLFPPALALTTVRAVLGENSEVGLGVQNIHWEPSGAYTGEISAEMAAEAGARFALVGHSERRHVFHETDEETVRKVGAARRAGLRPVLCLGETLEEREAGRLEGVLYRQLDAVLTSKVGPQLAEEPPSLLLAYEPVWAIGTGRTATPGDAAEAHGLLRARVAEVLGEHFAQAVPILYGGSVKPENAADLLAASDVGGLLVGGASLDPASFTRIAEAAG